MRTGCPTNLHVERAFVKTLHRRGLGRGEAARRRPKRQVIECD
jgi:hypothetical protein